MLYHTELKALIRIICLYKNILLNSKHYICFFYRSHFKYLSNIADYLSIVLAISDSLKSIIAEHTIINLLNNIHKIRWPIVSMSDLQNEHDGKSIDFILNRYLLVSSIRCKINWSQCNLVCCVVLKGSS